MSSPTSTPLRKRVPSASICASRRSRTRLLHLELGDAVAQQAAGPVGALVDGDGVAGAGQLLGGGQAGRPGADDGDGLAGEALGRLRRDRSRASKAWSMVVTSTCLIVTAGWLMPSTHAVSHGAGQSRPVNSGKLFVACRRSMASAQSPAPREVVPLGDQVAERTTAVAERDAAVHAAAGLALQLPELLLLVDLLPVPDAHRDGSARRQLALARLEKALGVSHGRPP